MINNPIVQEFLMDITNNDKYTFPIIECIINGTTSDLDISEETEILLTTVRKILYKLHDAGIATYKKAKDPKTKLDISIWNFDKQKMLDIITKKYENISDNIDKSILYEKENMFFACKTNGHRYIFEQASISNFICPKCGESLEFQDNSNKIEELIKEKDKCKSIGKINL
jgi:transcription initiation factor TFIIE subunit alpha